MNSASPQLQVALTDEHGAAYSLSVVMVTPIYALLMCLILESALMMVAKLGTVYAGYAAARTAVVWSSATDSDRELKKKVAAAAHRSFTPFASGTQEGWLDLPHRLQAELFASKLRAYQLAAGRESPVSRTVIRKKHANARRFLKAKIKQPPQTWDADLTIELEYRFRFNVPGVGRLIGQRSLWDGHYYFPVRTEVTLQNEGPQNDKQELGIGYGTF